MARGDVHHAIVQDLPPFGFDDVRTTKAVQPGGKRAGKGFWHMLHDKDWRTIRRKSEQKVLDRLGTPGRRPDKNDPARISR